MPHRRAFRNARATGARDISEKTFGISKLFNNIRLVDHSQYDIKVIKLKIYMIHKCQVTYMKIVLINGPSLHCITREKLWSGKVSQIV